MSGMGTEPPLSWKGGSRVELANSRVLTNVVLCCLQDSEGILIINIGSYMGGVDLWQNEEEHEDEFDTQSMHDKVLEVVGICGTWHLGKLQVNSPTFGSFPIPKTLSTHEYTALILRSVLKLVDLMMDSVLYR